MPTPAALRSVAGALVALSCLLSGCRKMGGLEGQPIDGAQGGTGLRPSRGAGGSPFGAGGSGEPTGSGGTSGTSGAGGDGAGGLSQDGGGAGGTNVTPPPEFSREALLGAFAGCAVTETAEFARRAEVLRDASVAHEATRTQETAGRMAAAWQDAADQWQILEVFQYGPAAMSSQPGGMELRNQIYIWPLFNRCLIEQLLVGRALGDTTFDAQFERFANARGLGAIEYLLFHSGTDNVCPAANPINKNGTWAALGEAGLGAAKAGYLRVTAEDVHRHAVELASAWATTGGNFHDTLAQAGSGSAVFTTMQEGLSAVSDALFYLHTETKDMKLATPMGLTETCMGTPCPWLVESPFSGRSKLNVRNNLVGFRKLFSGCRAASDLGFDDLLVDIGQGAVAERMAALIDAAIAAVDAIPGDSLEGALGGDMQKIWALYDAVKAISDLLKTDFVSVLNLGRPPSAGTDND